ncbi:hypothetical protein L7F22_046768 [Adiantum nelumboides]|nr:hypothetical protein [Adiantum nelumboides]
MLSKCQIVVLSGARLAQIITDFEAITGLRNMCGAIDGTHIKLVRKPVVDFPAQYVSRHGFHSILLQDIVNFKKLFWNVVCNAPGRSHVSNVFKSSQIYRDMKSCEILSEPLIELNHLSIKPYLVGDSVYKPTSFLTFKSKARQDLALKNAFDKQIAKGRVKVENAFGILKNRWRILRDFNVSFSFAPNVVIAYCVLHNYVQLKGEPEPHDAIDPHPNDGEPLRWRTVTRQRTAGLKMRTALLSDFAKKLLPLFVSSSNAPKSLRPLSVSSLLSALSRILFGCPTKSAFCFPPSSRWTKLYPPACLGRSSAVKVPDPLRPVSDPSATVQTLRSVSLPSSSAALRTLRSVSLSELEVAKVTFSLFQLKPQELPSPFAASIPSHPVGPIIVWASSPPWRTAGNSCWMGKGYASKGLQAPASGMSMLKV